MNDPIARLREHLPTLRKHDSDKPDLEHGGPDLLQLLTAKLLLFTAIGAAADAVRNGSSVRVHEDEMAAWERGSGSARPIAWAPALLGGAAAIAHAVHAFLPSERSRLAARTLDVATVGAGLLGLVDGLAASRRTGALPAVGSISLASAGLMGILIDRSEEQNEAERQHLERRARVVERLVPQRRPRLDRIVVHV